jgi:hypothetical protein
MLSLQRRTQGDPQLTLTRGRSSPGQLELARAHRLPPGDPFEQHRRSRSREPHHTPFGARPYELPRS